MQGQNVVSSLWIINAHLFKKWQSLMTTRQLEGCHLHVGGCRIEGTQLKAQLVSGFSGMNFPWVDQNYPAWQGKMLYSVVCKGLSALLDQTNYIIVMTMAC